jgi:hypothetical protein
VPGGLFADIVLYIPNISVRNLFFYQNACVCVPSHNETAHCTVRDAFLGHIKLYDHHIDWNLYIFCGLFNGAFSRWTIQHRIKGWQANDELKRIFKEAVMAYSRRYIGICPKGLKKARKDFSPGWYLNRIRVKSLPISQTILWHASNVLSMLTTKWLTMLLEGRVETSLNEICRHNWRRCFATPPLTKL